MPTPLALERRFWRQNAGLVIGFDEAGRGPLAGEVVAGAIAVIDQPHLARYIKPLTLLVRDSKKLSPKQREIAYQHLTGCPAIQWAYGIIDSQTIDKINILEASKMAMVKAGNNLLDKIDPARTQKVQCLIDGNFKIYFNYPQRSIIAGDAKVFSISAASIIAKVTRDRMMLDLDRQYPAYGFARHKGYPTRQHLLALASFGACPKHRFSFAPVAAISKNKIKS